MLLKLVDETVFVSPINPTTSAKAEHLDANPHAALVFYWSQLDRQVRVEGSVVKTSAQESREYFRTRPREKSDRRVGIDAKARRSAVERLSEQRAHEIEALYRDREIDCPEHWGGYRLKPERIEFWKSRIGRLHDRILYQRDADGWSITRSFAPSTKIEPATKRQQVTRSQKVSKAINLCKLFFVFFPFSGYQNVAVF